MFDRYVAGTKPSWKRRALIIASIALHGLAALTLIVYALVHVEEITPPALSLTFFNAAPPPPPPPPPPAHHKSTPHPHPVVHPVVQPTVVQPIQVPKEEPKDEDDGQEGGVEGGVAGGVAGGVVGGVVGGKVGGTGQKPKNVGAHTLDTQVIYRPDPQIPDIIKIQRKGTGDATFTAKVCINNAGSVSQVNVYAGIPGADDAIVSTIKKWRYKPQPIPVCFIANWVFSFQ